MNQAIVNPGPAQLRKFGLVSGAIVIALFGVALPWLFDYSWPLWPWILAATLALWALLAPASLFIVYRVWMSFGNVAGWINTRIILGLIFYLVILPIGILLRLFGKDPMARKIDRSSKSYRVISARAEKDHIEKPY